MMPSPPTHQPSDARLWPALGQHRPRLLQVNKSSGIAPPTLSSSARCARQPRHPHPSRDARQVGEHGLRPGERRFSILPIIPELESRFVTPTTRCIGRQPQSCA